MICQNCHSDDVDVQRVEVNGGAGCPKLSATQRKCRACGRVELGDTVVNPGRAQVKRVGDPEGAAITRPTGPTLRRDN